MAAADSPQAGQIGIKALDPRCAGHVGFRIPGAERHVWGKLTDISLGGCYVEVVTPAAKETKLELVMQISGVEMALTGEVRTSVPSLGMGVEFTGFPGDVRERLEQLLQKLRPPNEAKLDPDLETSLPARWDEIPSGASPPKAVCDPIKLLAALREFFSENDVLTREDFKRLLEDSKGREI